MRPNRVRRPGERGEIRNEELGIGRGTGGAVVGGAARTPRFLTAKVRRRERPPYGTRKHGGHPGNATPAAIANPCRGRCSHRPGVFAAAQGSAGGINPAPTGKFFVSGKPGGRDVCPGLQGRFAARQGGPIWNRPLHGVFTAAQGLREGHAPPLHAVRERPAKWDCRGHPGERRAGCPHPAGPRGGGNVPGFEFQRCGGRERPPCGPGETRRPPGKMQPPRPLQTHVGDDARIVPGCLRRRRVPRAG